MTKTYTQKENIMLWYFLLFISIGIIIFGYMLIKYFAWQVLPLIVITISKIIQLHKNPAKEAIALNEEGIKLLNSLEKPFYPYSNISNIKINSKFTNGYLTIKDTNKKVIINSVAINIDEQREIVTFVKNKIFKKS